MTIMVMLTMMVMMMMMMTLLCCAAQRSHPAWEGLVGCQMAKYKRARCKSHVKKYRFWICINFALDWARTDLAVFIDALAAQNIRPRIFVSNTNTLTQNIDIFCQNIDTFCQRMILGRLPKITRSMKNVKDRADYISVPAIITWQGTLCIRIFWRVQLDVWVAASLFENNGLSWKIVAVTDNKI